jgi:hypothetical protein
VLAPDWLIAVLTCMVAGGLWLLYPRQALERRLSETADSPLSAAYLHNLLRSDPENPTLRLLRRQQILHGEMDSAHVTLAPALASSNPEIHRDALWTLWELRYTQYVRTPEDRQDERQKQLPGCAPCCTLAAEEWPLDRQRRLITLAAQFGDDALRKRLEQQWAQTQPQQQPQDATSYERAAHALAAGDYAGSAELFMLARNTSDSAAQAKHLFHEALRTLRAGDPVWRPGPGRARVGPAGRRPRHPVAGHRDRTRRRASRWLTDRYAAACCAFPGRRA